MALAVPKLEVCFIDFSTPKQDDCSPVWKKVLKQALFVVAPIPIVVKAIVKEFPVLKRMVEHKKFTCITTQNELEAFINANGNDWIIHNNALDRRQFYIRHPRKVQRNILVESNTFYKYIEEEQKDELIQFIQSHCSPKVIRIDRTEISNANAGVSAKVNGLDVSGGFSYGMVQGNYLNINYPNGTAKLPPRDHYLWIDKSVMRSIESLTEGASVTQSYEQDYTFGLNLKEAKALGLDVNMCKNFSYTIHVEC